MNNKKGQLTIFIIIAILIVALVTTFFVFKDSLIKKKIPSSIEPVYNNLASCLEGDVLTGIDVLESQGGYIELPEFEPGSSHMPFSSQLNFLGNPIPYWYYVSGNNIEREQVPSKTEMEEQLADFVESQISKCVFKSYYEQGFEIDIGKPEARINIKDKEVVLELIMNFGVVKGDDSFHTKTHRVIVDSDLGSLYNSAQKIYQKEQEELFLESYGIDVLRLYAPVDGVELTCSPKVWEANSVFDELQKAIEANTLALRTKGASSDYFVVDVPVEHNVMFLNSKDWPYSFEVSPSDENILIANPVGNQPGLGLLGFCYVPYHFVYNMKYPVLVQIFSGDEIFQFPLAVVIQGNNPREPLEGSAVEMGEVELCKYKNTVIEVNVYDRNSNPVDADISYECFGTKCNIGKTQQGKLREGFPQCVNGYVLARAEGFEDAKILHSTVNRGSLNVVLEKLYELDVRLKIDGTTYNREGVIYFISDSSKTIIYPQQRSVELSEGQYEIQVYVYKNSSLELGVSVQEQCIEVPRGAVGGLFGLTKKECFELEFPSQVISNALAGGGKQERYISESELKSSSRIEIDASSLPPPNSLEQLQDNYVLFENKGLGVTLI